MYIYREQYMDEYTIRPIAYVHSDYNEKFGIPRQPGLAEELEQSVVIEPAFRNGDALRGIEDFTHLWLIWGFSQSRLDMEEDPVRWHPTVRPPWLGGNMRKGVWATRSPYRPNSLAISCVRLVRIEHGGRTVSSTSGIGETSESLALIVSGADMMDGTPVYDIKPYIPYSDSHPEASGGFTDSISYTRLRVDFPDDLLEKIDAEKRAGLISALEGDPRGAYNKQPGHVYGMSFADWDIRFTVDGEILRVTDVADESEDAADRIK